MFGYILLFIIFTFPCVFLYYLLKNNKKRYVFFDKNRIIIKDNSISDYSNSDFEEFRQRSEDNLVF